MQVETVVGRPVGIIPFGFRYIHVVAVSGNSSGRICIVNAWLCKVASLNPAT